MGLSLTEKIINSHLVSGEMAPGKEIGLKIDQTLTQDATGTMAYLQLEAMGLPRVKTELSLAYIDHNTLQAGFENADDHLYIQSVAAKYGIYFSRPGNGICHQVHLERFGRPGKTLLGSDSHTPTGGGLGMLAMGAGGLDVAVAMGGGAYYIEMPRIINIELTGKLPPWVSAKDIILEMLRRLTVKGGVGAIVEYSGPALAYLSVPERATMTNMGAELGATASIFPSDQVTKDFLKAQARESHWVELMADSDAVYEEKHVLDLNTLLPLAACPHSPDNVHPVSKLNNVQINQVCIGSCTNSSLSDMLKVARILKGRTIHPEVSLGISPGSKQVLAMLTETGALGDLINAGARILECACGPCIGMGFSPPSKGISLRTFNRNFPGRSGTADAQVYLVSPETAAASALTGWITDPRTLGKVPQVALPENYLVDDRMVLAPPPEEKAKKVAVKRGPNIKPLPEFQVLSQEISAAVLLKVGDNITTDHIMPAGAKILPYRSNIPYLAKFCFAQVDPGFSQRALEAGQGFIVAGTNYGQGSSREHAALVPLYLGIKGIIAQSFARIHRANLINNGILPLTFVNPEDYHQVEPGDELLLAGLEEDLSREGHQLTLINQTKNYPILLDSKFSTRQWQILQSGGLLNFTKGQVNPDR